MPDGLYPEGELESIYFDDAALSAYREKANGDALKRKIRMRWYRTGRTGGDTDAFLEVKDRIGSARDKARHRFTAPLELLEGASLSDPALAGLLRRTAEEAGFAVRLDVVPVVAIRYRRLRFVCPVTGARVSLDFNISCERANGAVFPSAAPFTLPAVVCEAKSDTAWSWPFGDDLARIGFRRESYSKYGSIVGTILEGGMA